MSENPYLVTVYRNGPWPHTSAMRDIHQRSAFGTLEDARDCIYERSAAAGLGPDDVPFVAGPEGGTTSPLPDGSFISVEQVTWDSLLSCIPEVDWPPAGDKERPLAQTRILAAYNELQARPA